MYKFFSFCSHVKKSLYCMEHSGAMKLYQRFSEYISATRILISAIFQIYRRNSNYISDFLNISISYQPKNDKNRTYTIKKVVPKIRFGTTFFTTLERVTSYLDYKTGSGSSAETSLHLHANQLLIYHPINTSFVRSAIKFIVLDSIIHIALNLFLLQLLNQ